MIKEKLFDLIKKAQGGDLEARNEIMVFYRYIIDNVAYQLRRLPVDISAKKYGATIGLMSAIKNFNFTNGFSRYAYVCAYRTAQREIAETEHMIYYPHEILNAALKEKKMPFTLERINYDVQIKNDFVNKTKIEFHPESLDAKMLVETFFSEVPLTNVEKDAIEYTSEITKYGLREYGKKNGITGEGFRINQQKVIKKFRAFLYKKGIKKEHVKH